MMAMAVSRSRNERISPAKQEYPAVMHHKEDCTRGSGTELSGLKKTCC